MSRLFPVYKKELRSYFNSPIAYIAVVFFLIFTSVWFFYINRFVEQNLASLRGYFGIMPLVFIILLPALTMRLWAEELKMGTAELLLTLPFNERDLVLGKYFASLSLFVLMIVLTLPVPILINPLGNFQWGQIFGEYLGVLLLGAAGISIGLFMSSVSSNQISAFIFGVIVLVVLTLANQVNMIVDLPAPLAGFFNYLALDYHFGSFKKGIIDSKDLLYFIVVIVLFLYLNIKVLMFRKWR
jgi:ABC-2 type transport system permease protein